MKYLTDDIAEKVCLPDGKQYEKEWNERINQVISELEAISYKLPKRFLKEFSKRHFHDYKIKSFSIEKRQLKSRFLYDLILILTDPLNSLKEHTLIFKNVKNIKSQFDIGEYPINLDWLYSEILPSLYPLKYNLQAITVFTPNLPSLLINAK